MHQIHLSCNIRLYASLRDHAVGYMHMFSIFLSCSRASPMLIPFSILYRNHIAKAKAFRTARNKVFNDGYTTEAHRSTFVGKNQLTPTKNISIFVDSTGRKHSIEQMKEGTNIHWLAGTNISCQSDSGC